MELTFRTCTAVICLLVTVVNPTQAKRPLSKFRMTSCDHLARIADSFRPYMNSSKVSKDLQNGNSNYSQSWKVGCDLAPIFDLTQKEYDLLKAYKLNKAARAVYNQLGAECFADGALALEQLENIVEQTSGKPRKNSFTKAIQKHFNTRIKRSPRQWNQCMSDKEKLYWEVVKVPQKPCCLEFRAAMYQALHEFPSCRGARN